MKTKLKSLLQQLLQSPRRLPVEAALGVVFFIIILLNEESSSWGDKSALVKSIFNVDVVALFFPLVVLSFWLQRVNRWAYYASFFLFIPLMSLNLDPFFGTYGYAFTFVLAALLLILGNRRMDNRTFAAHALHVITQTFFGFLITCILHAAVLAIVQSICYIFGFDGPWHLYEYITYFIWLVPAPQICFTLIRQDEDKDEDPPRILQLILNYILSPAIIIYTVILYVYFIKITLQWDLPKGDVAWLVMGFISIALAGRIVQTILSPRYYEWFYRHFTLIAIPPLIMYWVGSLYRIRLYSFTESRFYLMVAGMLMTLFVLMLFRKYTRRYQLMALIFGVAIIVFTYIPGISAKSIGLSCQKQRLKEFFTELKLTDNKTGKLKDKIDISNFHQDSLMCEKYKELCSVVRYVRDEIGDDKFSNKYGKWTFTNSDFYYEKKIVSYSDKWYDKEFYTVDLGEYRIMQPECNYRLSFEDMIIQIKESGNDSLVLQYPINDIIRQDTSLLSHPEQLFSYHNDSLMLVIDQFCLDDSIVSYVNNLNFNIFKKIKK